MHSNIISVKDPSRLKKPLSTLAVVGNGGWSTLAAVQNSGWNVTLPPAAEPQTAVSSGGWSNRRLKRRLVPAAI